eukprot:g3638.t1
MRSRIANMLGITTVAIMATLVTQVAACASPRDVTTASLGCAYGEDGVDGSTRTRYAHLYCDGRGISGDIRVTDIHPDVKTISFADNDIGCLDPSSFALLNDLIFVDTSRNSQLSITCADSGCKWEHLGCNYLGTELHCHGRQITGNLYISNVKAGTTRIHLNGNDIAAVDPRTYEPALSTLQRVFLHNNRHLLNSCDVDGCAWQSLGCYISSRAASTVARYYAFKEKDDASVLRCDISPQQVSKIFGPVYINNIPSGTRLVTLNQNSITSIDPRSFQDIEDTLEYVHFDENPELINSCASSGCSYQSIGCFVMTDESKNTLSCHTDERPHHRGVTGPIYINNVPDNVQLLLFYGASLGNLDERMRRDGLLIRQLVTGPGSRGDFWQNF